MRAFRQLLAHLEIAMGHVSRFLVEDSPIRARLIIQPSAHCMDPHSPFISQLIGQLVYLQPIPSSHTVSWFLCFSLLQTDSPPFFSLLLFPLHLSLLLYLLLGDGDGCNFIPTGILTGRKFPSSGIMETGTVPYSPSPFPTQYVIYMNWPK